MYIYIYVCVWHEIRRVCKITLRDIIATHVYIRNNNIYIYCCVRASATDAHRAGPRRRVSFNWRQCGRGAFVRDRLDIYTRVL
jgi:hypothetical protein